ncbi:MAG: response regulator transcription factor [Acidimicrobiia bacterium]|nr:MAG: response regulator transcription factor [Acidimicrobiia bacterium]
MVSWQYMPSILIIEDEQRIRESLAIRLSERGYDIETVARAIDGVERAVSGDFDVVVLDLGLPDLDGAEALRMIRAVSHVPVVVATARDDEADIISVLDAGADDYVIKPFSADHLAARIRAVLRRSGEVIEDDTITVGELCLDLDAHEATLQGRQLDLTARAFDLLAYLASRPGKLVSKRELLAEVWRQPYGGADKTVDVHISWLRKELGETAAEPKYLHTRRGVGVRLVDPTR